MVLGFFLGLTVVVARNSACGVWPVDLPSAAMTNGKAGIRSLGNGLPAASTATVFHVPCNALSSVRTSSSVSSASSRGVAKFAEGVRASSPNF